MKNLKELTGVKVLAKNEQKLIKGGLGCSIEDPTCPPYSYCYIFNEYGDGRCVPL
ncbi:MAG: hypothetical protein HOO91_18035 [Bacteroidales bacterium]|nr:hypothetical protein [Bacteroidales bacterium]